MSRNFNDRERHSTVNRFVVGVLNAREDFMQSVNFESIYVFLSMKNPNEVRQKDCWRYTRLHNKSLKHLNAAATRVPYLFLQIGWKEVSAKLPIKRLQCDEVASSNFLEQGLQDVPLNPFESCSPPTGIEINLIELVFRTVWHRTTHTENPFDNSIPFLDP